MSEMAIFRQLAHRTPAEWKSESATPVCLFQIRWGGELHTGLTQYAVQYRSSFGVTNELGRYLLATAIIPRNMTSSAEFHKIGVAQWADKLLTPCWRSIRIELPGQDECRNATDYRLVFFCRRGSNLPRIANFGG